ncbi:hypothetical protein Hanom_Chr08g00745041 [Helianthus anomalus]
MREWRTMHRKHAEQEVHRSRLAIDAKNFEKAKAELVEKQLSLRLKRKKKCGAFWASIKS